MAETQSTTPTTTEATAPTGDIKVFIDAFNKDFDAELKKLVDAQQNYKNVYADAIKITTPKEGPWPNDPKVVTIGDLFKYTFPDIESDKIVVPPSNNLLYDEKERENYRGWSNDIKNSEDEKVKTMYSIISSGIRSNKKIENYQSLKKPGITNPSLWSPGQYYFDIFMYEMLSPYGPLKDPTGANGGESAFGGDLIEGGGGRLNGWLKANGGSASVSNFNADGIGATGSFGYINFYEIIDRGYVDQGVKYRMINSTGIDINLDDADTKPPKSFPSLFTQYRTGPLSEFISFVNSKIIRKDPKFNIYEGIILNPLDKEIELSKEWDNLSTLTDLTGYKFVGYYEHRLLYKAFIQAGDNYKSVVLPLRNPEPPAPEVVTKPIVNLPQEVGYTFNVEKKDSFVIVGGGSMSGIEFTIVPNDGTTYIISTPDLYDELPDEEYMEGDFTGSEEGIVNTTYNELITTIDNFDYQSPTTTNSDNKTEDNNINFTNVSPGEQVKHLYEFIQKRVKNKYKYIGTPVYNVSQADLLKLLSITKKYGIPFEWVANLINHESAGTWNPSIRNSIGATGLIQFMTTIGKTRMTYAKADGSNRVDTDTLRSMTFSNHLDYVEGFIYSVLKKKLTNGKVKKEFTQTDLFMTIFTPAAVGKPNYTFSAGTQKSNKGIVHPIDYTKKACNEYSPFPLVPDDLVRYVAKIGNGLIENSNVA